ncbi:MAG: hypothetical protein ACLFV3_00290 [Phycisphaeraceae bacterium]
MKLRKLLMTFAAIMSLSVAGVGLTGCEDEGELGEENGFGEVEQETEELGQETEDAFEDAGDEMDEEL